MALQQTGKHAEAVEQYRKVLARNPRCEEALSNLVAMFLEKKDHASVRRYAEMLTRDPARFAHGHRSSGRPGLSGRRLTPPPRSTAARWRRPRPTASNTGSTWAWPVTRWAAYEKATQAYRQAASLQPGSAQAHLNLGVTQQELNDLAGARASYERALNIDPRQSGVLWNLALVLEQQGERQWAEKLYARINEDAPEWCDASFRLGYLRLLRGDYANSAEAFEACLVQRADWPEAHLNAGIAYARSGNGQAARKSFQDALMLRPDSSDAVRGLAALALEQEDFNDAYDQHRRLIELGEHGPELFYNAGLICQKRGQTQDAVTFYQQALNEDPQFAEALLNLGHALMSLGQEDDARSFWRRAIREKPELAQTYFEPPVAVEDIHARRRAQSTRENQYWFSAFSALFAVSAFIGFGNTA